MFKKNSFNFKNSPPGGERDIIGKNRFLHRIMVTHREIKTAESPIPMTMPTEKAVP